MSAYSRVLTSLLLALTCRATFADAPKIIEGEIKRLNAETILIRGLISPGLETKFRAALDEKTRAVVLSSPGGATKTALDIAEHIQARGLDVIVRKYCISSCANYLFIAGSKKTVEQNSIVAWHGGHSNDPFPSDVADKFQMHESAQLLRREQLLHLRARTSLDLVVYSGLLTAGKPTGEVINIEMLGKRVSVPKLSRDYSHWVPTRAVLARLGVRNIASFWHPGTDEKATRLLRDLGISDARAFTGEPYSYIPQMFRLSSADR